MTGTLGHDPAKDVDLTDPETAKILLAMYDEDPAGEQAARAMLGQSLEGVDPVTGLPLNFGETLEQVNANNGLTGAPDADENDAAAEEEAERKIAEERAEAERAAAEAAKAGDGEQTGDETGTEAKPEGGDQTGDQTTEDLDPLLASMRSENRFLREQIAALQAKSPPDGGGGQQTGDQTGEQTQTEDPFATALEQAEAMREEVGDDVTNPLVASIRAMQARDQAQTAKIDEVLERMGALTDHIRGSESQSVDADIAQVPELAQWQADARAAAAGDESKSARLFEQALEANKLLDPAEWAGKPRVERLTRITDMVKVMNGMELTAPAKTETKPTGDQTGDDKKGGTKTAPDKTATAPFTLSDIAGSGETGKSRSDLIADADPFDLIFSGISVEEINNVAATLH